MKLTTAVVCTKCTEVFDSQLYRVCPACAGQDSYRVLDKMEKTTADAVTKKCK